MQSSLPNTIDILSLLSSHLVALLTKSVERLDVLLNMFHS
jgi:hypothetical protein